VAYLVFEVMSMNVNVNVNVNMNVNVNTWNKSIKCKRSLKDGTIISNTSE